MRSVATFRLANLVTGVTPGRLFQISTSRLLSGPIRSANCSSLAKTPAPVSRAAFLEGCTVMLLSVSIVNVFIIFLLVAALGGHDIDHSEVLEKQGNLAVNRRWRRSGDGRRSVAQIDADCAS
jgi:hypothetical protein